MTTAIFEILGLLTVSCLIGVFFTYRYWKAKVDKLEIEKSALEAQGIRLSEERDDLKKSNSSLVLEKQAAEQETGELKEKIKSLEEEKSKHAADKEKAKSSSAAKAKPEDPKKIKGLEDKIEILEQNLGEKERELQAVSVELTKKSVSYYKQIDGKRYKAATILMADEAVEGKGDGRISKEDAQEIFDTISDGHQYTQVEKDTMHYLRENYNWTDGADELFRTKVRSWAAKGHDLDA